MQKFTERIADQAVYSPFSGKKAHNEYGGEGLGQYGGDGCSADPQPETEDKERIQSYIGRGAQGDGCHADKRESLRVDKWIHAGSDHGEDISGQINAEIRNRKRKRLFRGSEKNQQRSAEKLPCSEQDDGSRQLQTERSIHQPFSPCGIAPARGNGEQGSPAGSVKVGEGCYHDNDRKTESYRSDGGGPDFRNACDIDSVYNVIEQIQDLGRQHGKRALKYAAENSSVFEINLSHLSAPFRYLFLQVQFRPVRSAPGICQPERPYFICVQPGVIQSSSGDYKGGQTLSVCPRVFVSPRRITAGPAPGKRPAGHHCITAAAAGQSGRPELIYRYGIFLLASEHSDIMANLFKRAVNSKKINDILPGNS